MGKKMKKAVKVIKKDNFMLKIALTEVVFLAMFIFTATHLDRITTFNNVVGSFVSFFKYASIIIFFVSLDFLVFFYSILTIWMIEGQIIKSDWISNAYHMDNKYDFFTFVFKVFSILLFIMIFVITPCSVVGPSMQPTFETNDSVITINLYFSPKKGDVIVFDAKKYTEDENFYIKRLVAVPGDEVKYDIYNNKFYINNQEENGVSLEQYKFIRLSKDFDLKYLESIARIVNADGFNLLDDMFSKLNDRFIFTVPDNKYLAFGDNRYNSYDSRWFGFIDKEAIYGKVFLRIYPFDKMGYYE